MPDPPASRFTVKFGLAFAGQIAGRPVGVSMSTLRQFRILVTLILSLIALRASAFSQNQPKVVMAYYESSGSDHSLRAFASYLNQIPTDTFAIDRDGNVSGTAPAAALGFAQSHGMQTFATVSNFGNLGFVPLIAHHILTHPVIRAKAIQNMLTVLQTYGYTGVNIDFEAVPHRDRAEYTAFIREVAKAMRGAGYLTVVSVPAELQDDPNDSWAGAFDFKALAPNVDVLQLMTYDENGPWGPPGPVAGLDWVEPCVQFAVSVVPSNKISLGIPAYGYDWNVTKATGVQVDWKQIPALMAKWGATPQWDVASSSPYFSYTSAAGSSHVVWFEDSKSIPIKSGLTVTYGLAGVSVFALGFEDQTFWDAITSGFGTDRY
jgi:spore germination protein YaaH